MAFAVRLYNINGPIAGHHSWRQADTASVARNFHENGYNFLYPQIDWGGNSPGYYESEFPAYQFIVALFYQFFGVAAVWGRLLSIVFSILALYYLYKLIEKYIDEMTALWSVFFLAFFPTYMFFSRAFMIESMLIMSVVTGVYFFSQWLTLEKRSFFYLSAFFVALSVLLKPYTLFIGLPLLYLAWLKFRNKLFLQGALWFYCLLAVVPAVLWYYHAYNTGQQYGSTVYIWEYGSDKWGNWDLVLKLDFWKRVIIDRLAMRHLTWACFAVFLAGLFLKRRTDQERLFDFWLMGVVIYFIIVAKGNYVHDYYQLLFLPPASVFAGKVYARFFSLKTLKSRNSLILIMCLAGFLLLAENRYYHLVKSERVNYTDRIELSEIIKDKVEEDALIIVVYKSYNPVIHYLSHRKGWFLTPDTLTSSNLTAKKQEGAKYAVGVKRYFESELHDRNLKALLAEHEVIADNEKFFIVRL